MVSRSMCCLYPEVSAERASINAPTPVFGANKPLLQDNIPLAARTGLTGASIHATCSDPIYPLACCSRPHSYECVLSTTSRTLPNAYVIVLKDGMSLYPLVAIFDHARWLVVSVSVCPIMALQPAWTCWIQD